MLVRSSEDAATVERIAPTKLKKLLELAALQLNEAMGKAKTVLEDLSTAERKDREAHLKVSTEMIASTACTHWVSVWTPDQSAPTAVPAARCDHKVASFGLPGISSH